MERDPHSWAGMEAAIVADDAKEPGLQVSRVLVHPRRPGSTKVISNLDDMRPYFLLRQRANPAMLYVLGLPVSPEPMAP